MEDLPVLVYHIDQKEFPDLTISDVIDDLWEMVYDEIKPPAGYQAFKVGMSFILQFWSSDDTNRPRTEKSYPRYWVDIEYGNISSSLLGEYHLKPTILYHKHS